MVMLEKMGVTLQNIEQKQDAILNKLTDKTSEQICKDILKLQKDEAAAWSDLLLHVPERCVNNLRQSPDSALDADAKIGKFVDDVDKKVMLVQGKAGTGKTLFVKHITAKYLNSQWLPIFVSLPLLSNPTKQLMQETLKEKFKLNDKEQQTL